MARKIKKSTLDKINKMRKIYGHELLAHRINICGDTLKNYRRGLAPLEKNERKINELYAEFEKGNKRT